MANGVATEDESHLAALHGDVLEAIISHVPTMDLFHAYYVSKGWQSAVRRSLLNPSRVKPWLVARIQSSHRPSVVVTHAYDPESYVWIKVPCVKSQLPRLPIRSSHSNLLYTLTASKLGFASDQLNAEWHEVDGPKIWRLDPIVARVGAYLVVAGGTFDFEDDPLAVEVYDSRSGEWKMCQSMPDILKHSATPTCLSVAVTEQNMFLLHKNSGIICTFDLETKTWGPVFDIRPPTGSLLFSLIGFLNHRLVLVGLISGDDANNIVESLRIWEVSSETFCCKEVAKMPPFLLKQVLESCSSPSSIDVSMAGDLVYICNPSNPKTIISCELSKGSCQWGSVEKSILNDENIMRRFIFTCSKIGINDLRKAFHKNN